MANYSVRDVGSIVSEMRRVIVYLDSLNRVVSSNFRERDGTKMLAYARRKSSA